MRDNGLNYLVDDEDSTNWWQKRKNARITEIDNEDELNAGPNGFRTNGEQPFQRTWVPPQPPPVVMPEAAEAIRRPKSSSAQIEASKQEQIADDQSVALTPEVNELQRSSGAVEMMNEGVSGMNNSEIQEQEHSFEGN